TMTEHKVPRDVAEEEFNRFLEAMDLEPIFVDDDDKKGFEDARQRIVRAMMRGQLVINDKGEPVFTPGDGKGDITFHEPTGNTFMATDQKRKNHDVAKSFAAMAECTKTSIARFATMSNRDMKVCQSIILLFLA